jgi:NADH:ubiquinone oxidoreductase subunit E
VKLTDKQQNEFKEQIQDYKNKKGSLLPILHLSMDLYRHIPVEIQELISEELKISNAHIAGVVSFYEMFHEFPTGKYHIGMCSGTTCHISGSHSLLKELEETLGIKEGETTEDGLFTIVPVKCVGFCDQAPNLLINDTVHHHMTSKELQEIIKTYKKDI